MSLKLYNSLKRKLEELEPLEKDHVKMYVCGPTVYDRAHLGNARSVVVYDVLYRLLKHLYPKVTYVRNITDVDDKIIKAAKERSITINQLTKEMTDNFHADMDALNVLRPTHEPKATENIKSMIAMIERLIKNGNAYAAEGHVLFSVASYKDYGKLSNRSRDEMVAGARVEVAPFKKDPADFVLWKPANAGDDASSVFDSPWGKGRPGWHIECSAMATNILGENFDIHGGGADLTFPHHENEVAQSCCANPKSIYAKTWVHNGFLTVNGEKMSKSLGNFTTVKDLLDKGVKGEVIRCALLSSHYRSPLDWTEKLLNDAKNNLDYLYEVLRKAKAAGINVKGKRDAEDKQNAVLALSNDLNFSAFFELLFLLGRTCNVEGFDKPDGKKFVKQLLASADLVGLLNQDPDEWFAIANPEAETLAKQAVEARKAKDYATSDKIRAEIEKIGYKIEFAKDGTYRLLKK